MSDVIGVGVDLCAVGRIARAIEKERFVLRVYTEEERAYLEARGAGRAQSAAALFAAKEAVAKALGTGFSGGVAMREISVGHDGAGRVFHQQQRGIARPIQKRALHLLHILR